jgi:CheY-like chemotaxis protein
VNTLEQQRDATGLIGRLRQVLGPSGRFARPSAGFYAANAEDMPGLYFYVAPDGAILSVSRALAETLGTGYPAKLRGRPIAAYLPAVATDTPLCQEIWGKGEIRNVPVRLLAPEDGTGYAALLSACADFGNGITPGAWMGCLTLSPAEDRHFSKRAAVDLGLLDGLRSEMRSQLDVLSLQFSRGGGGDAPGSLPPSVRMYLVFLPRLEAILALNTPSAPQVFDAKTSITELCRDAGRLLESAGVSLIFDTDPEFPSRVSTDENRLRTCLNLLLGAVSTTEAPAEIMVRLAFEDARFINIEVVVAPAPGRPVLSAERASEFELSKALAATADGVLLVDPGSPECRKYILRIRASVASESGAAIEAPAGGNEAIDRALEGLRVLFIGPGEGQRTVIARWMERQHVGFLHAAAPWEAQAACGGVPPDVAVLDLSVCPELPDFLREVPVLGLRGSLVSLPEWCRTSIETPVFEEDLLDGIGSLRPRIDPAEWEPRQPAGSSAMRILAVEDNPVNQRIIQKMLLRLGYEVDLAANGLEALVALRKRPYDTVLMDWEMPVMDGLEATAAIRGFPEPLCRIPIIAITAHAIPGDREACLNGGMDDYLSKPVNVDVLRPVLDKWLPLSPRLPRPEL